jgi:hypothetical protein
MRPVQTVQKNSPQKTVARTTYLAPVHKRHQRTNAMVQLPRVHQQISLWVDNVLAQQSAVHGPAQTDNERESKEQWRSIRTIDCLSTRTCVKCAIKEPVASCTCVAT